MPENSVEKKIMSGELLELSRDSFIRYLEHKSYVTFAEIDTHFENTKGDFRVGFQDKNIILWDGLSITLYQILTDLVNEGKIGICQEDPLIYWIDGCVLEIPVARRNIKYKTLRWLPVSISLYEEVRFAKNLLPIKWGKFE